MTTVVAVESKGTVTLGWDSQVTTGMHGFEWAGSKVFVNNGLIFGGAGYVRFLNILQYLQVPDFGGKDPDRYVVTQLIPRIQETLKDADAAELENGRLSTDSLTLVVVKNRVYDIGTDLSWSRRRDGIYAIGSGSRYAVGALSAGADIRSALRIASKHDIGTGGRLTVKTSEEILG